MKFVAAPALIIPAGTAAATVIAQSATTDPAILERRWSQIASRSIFEQSHEIERWCASGVFIRRDHSVLVLRILRDGQRHYAAIAVALPEPAGTQAETQAETQAQTPAQTPAQSSRTPTVPPLTYTPLTHVVALDHAFPEYTEVLEASARVRPLFHGSADDGCTYSGFAAEEPELILGLLTAAHPAAAAHIGNTACVVGGVTAFFSGPAVPIPAGLVLVPTSV